MIWWKAMKIFEWLNMWETNRYISFLSLAGSGVTLSLTSLTDWAANRRDSSDWLQMIPAETNTRVNFEMDVTPRRFPATTRKQTYVSHQEKKKKTAPAAENQQTNVHLWPDVAEFPPWSRSRPIKSNHLTFSALRKRLRWRSSWIDCWKILYETQTPAVGSWRGRCFPKFVEDKKIGLLHQNIEVLLYRQSVLWKERYVWYNENKHFEHREIKSTVWMLHKERLLLWYRRNDHLKMWQKSSRR